MAGTPPIIALVVAMAENNVIGRNGRLPWRIPSELQHFKRITMGKPVIMGRKTFISLKKPLEGRDNIVLTRDPAFGVNGALHAATLEEAIHLATKSAKAHGADEIMVIGGAQIYEISLGLAQRIYLTRIHAAVEGDTYFPALDTSEWRETEAARYKPGPKDDYGYTLSILNRI
ncbi:MAG TPA: dihydrofolate reductase [Hyphomicrobiales bacterium]|nr:dihydrofolate reductase [Hyphomicrobiales bacterium]